MDYEVRHIHGHFEIYVNGKFYCTVDNMVEVDEEIENLKAVTIQN